MIELFPIDQSPSGVVLAPPEAFLPKTPTPSEVVLASPEAFLWQTPILSLFPAIARLLLDAYPQ